jgi:hypothetical protein
VNIVSKFENIIPVLDQIKIIEEKIKTINEDHMDFNKNSELEKLRFEKTLLFDNVIESLPQNDFDHLEVHGIPDKDLYYILTSEASILEEIGNSIIDRTYSNRDFIDKVNDNNYITRIKSIFDCAQMYKDMAKFVSLMNTSDQNFIEAVEVLYEMKINLCDAKSPESRLAILQKTEMMDVIPSFYSIKNLNDELNNFDLNINNIDINLNQRVMLSNVILKYNLRPSLLVNHLSLSRIKFDNLLYELYPMFSNSTTIVNHYTRNEQTPYYNTFHVNYLYNLFKQYIPLYNSAKAANKVNDALNNVKNNIDIKNMLTQFETLSKEIIGDVDKIEYEEELKQLQQSKNFFGKKKRNARISELEALLSSNAAKEKQLSGRNDKLFELCFETVRRELEAKGLSPRDVSRFDTWEDISKDISKEIVKVMSNMYVDGVTMTMDQIVKEVISPFEINARIIQDEMDAFNKKNNVNSNVDINRVMQFIDMCDNSKKLNALEKVTTITPYSDKDIADYYITDSLTNVNKVYQDLINKNIKMATL